MKKHIPFIFLISIILNFTACKTQEQIQREQIVDRLSLQMVQGQQNSGETLVKVQELEEQLLKLKGEMDENDHSRQQDSNNSIKSLQSRIALLEESQKSTLTSLETTQNALSEQKRFLEKVLKTLGGMNRPKKIKKKKKRSAYDEAMFLYKGRKYTKSKPRLIRLLSNKKIKGNRRARIYHNLGMIEFIKKKNEDSLIYFSKLMTEFPKAKYNANGLLFMSKAFKRLNRKEESKQTLEELLKRYPKAKQAEEAKKILKKM